MDTAKAKELYTASLAAGYPYEEAKSRTFKFLKTGEVEPDPTDAIWGATIKQESGGNQAAVSPKGATGVAQVMPSTGPEAAKLAGLEWDPVAFKTDKAYNEAIGRAYMRQQFKDFNNNPKLALAAYNAGPNRVRKVLAGEATLPSETKNYVATITGNSQMADDPKAKARAVYDQMVAKGASPDEIKAEIGKVLGKQPKTPVAAMVSQPAQQAPGVADQPAEQAEPSIGDSIHDYLQEDVKSKLDRGHDVGAGSNSTIVGTLQGMRKLYNQATGDDAAVARINRQNQQDKDFWEQKDPSGSGVSQADLGKLLGNTGQFMAGPGGVVGGAATGAVQGLVAPTTANESQLGNAAIGGALGGALPAIGTGLRKLIGTPSAEKTAAAEALRQVGVRVPGSANYDSPLGSMLAKGAGETGQDMAPGITTQVAKLAGAPELTNDVLENQLRQTGSKIGDLSEGLVAQPDKGYRDALLGIGSKYLNEGLDANESDPVMKALDDLLRRGQQPLRGEESQALRSQLGGLSIKGTPQDKVAYKGMKSALDDLMQPELEKAGRGTDKSTLNSQYRMLKLLRSGKGIPSEGITPSALSNKIETASNKGAVSNDLRELLRNAATVAPKARLGADASSEGVERLLDRPQGLVSALMRMVPAAGNILMRPGVLQALVNNGAAGKATSETTRNALLPILLRLNSGE